MIPASFEYLAPTTIGEAVSLLAQHGEDAKILAGGHSLIPAMKLRLANPQLVIDIGRIRGLSYIREEGNQILIGAMTTHYEIESSARLREICPLLPETAAVIGDAQVRNKGTLGGSLAHADPAADWPAPVLALDAEIVAVSSKGERTIRANDFFVDMMTTALEPGEIIREIRVSLPKAKLGQAYMKVPQPASGFAVVGVAVSLVRGSNGSCAEAAVGITGLASKPYRALAVEKSLKGATLDPGLISAAAAHASDGVDANGDLYASADYRRHLASVYTRRAVELAASRST